MGEKKIKRWRVKGTSEDGWVDGLGFHERHFTENTVLPIVAVEIEYESVVTFNVDGTCSCHCCFCGGADAWRCKKYKVYMRPGTHLCPDAVLLKSEVAKK